MGQYDIGLSGAASSGANLNSPFSVTGGGGSNAPGAKSALNLTVLALCALVVVGGLIGILIWRR